MESVWQGEPLTEEEAKALMLELRVAVAHEEAASQVFKRQRDEIADLKVEVAKVPETSHQDIIFSFCAVLLGIALLVYLPWEISYFPEYASERVVRAENGMSFILDPPKIRQLNGYVSGVQSVQWGRYGVSVGAAAVLFGLAYWWRTPRRVRVVPTN